MDLFIFVDGGGEGVKILVIFCEHHKLMTPYMGSPNYSVSVALISHFCMKLNRFPIEEACKGKH